MVFGLAFRDEVLKAGIRFACLVAQCCGARNFVPAPDFFSAPAPGKKYWLRLNPGSLVSDRLRLRKTACKNCYMRGCRTYFCSLLVKEKLFRFSLDKNRLRLQLKNLSSDWLRLHNTGLVIKGMRPLA